MEDKLAWFNEVERLIDVLGIINTRIDKEEGYKVEKERTFFDEMGTTRSLLNRKAAEAD